VTERATPEHSGCIAHTKGNGARPHGLRLHLDASSALARGFAEDWGAEDLVALAALWHDLGKHSPEFQAMIHAVGESGHLEGSADFRKRKVDHSSAGALHACQTLGEPGLQAAFIIAGHHAGLADFRGPSGLEERLSSAQPLLEAASINAPPDILAVGKSHPPQRPRQADPSLWIRMASSAVFDADFLDTEEYFNADRTETRHGWATLAELSSRLDVRLAEFAGKDGAVDRVRAQVLTACRQAAHEDPGLHTLSVPTGGGKTLSSLAFAIDHARHNGLRRVIYAVPFTSIIEQTADVFRSALGDDAVLEHHSALDPADPGRENNRSRLASENWDAPIIVTTTVQLFESLFAYRTSRLRKLHNIAKSVIVLDEAQAIPVGVLRPVTTVLKELVTTYKATVVLCTATQPALHAVFKDLPPVREIAPGLEMPERVQVEFPKAGERRSWADIAAAMAAEPQALAIVNSRADCRTLHGLLPPGAIHLSTWQCAAHRAELLRALKDNLKAGKPVRVAATSLIEAGVDISFPAVFRALAGLDSIAQAAGRCNREGDLPDRGRVVVFRPEGGKMGGYLLQTAQATEEALRVHGEAPFAATAFAHYFKTLYWSRGNLDEYGMEPLLGLGGTRRGRPWYDIAFHTAAERFRMIDDAQDHLIVRYDARAADAVESLRKHGPTRATLRALQRYTVPVPRAAMTRLRSDGAVEDVVDGVTVLVTDELYDRDGVGLKAE